ncbi:MAG: hypothetical protein N2441_08000 [Rhodocyclaceae bacterium]|nr:hypothetical protein [Rhodocyclaceae bacterium]
MGRIFLVFLLAFVSGFYGPATAASYREKDLHLAAERLTLGDYAGAAALLDRLVDAGFQEPLVADALWDEAVKYRGIARAAQGDFAAAEEDAKRLASPKSSLTPPEYGHLLLALVKLWRHDKAALADYDKAIELARQGLASGARSAIAHALRGWAWLHFGEVEKARADFQTALSIDGTTVFLDFLIAHRPFWQAILNEALPLFAAREPLQGLAKIDDIVRRQELWARAWLPWRRKNKIEGDGAASLLAWEVHGSVAALRAHIQREAENQAKARQREYFAVAQQALLENAPNKAFDAFVAAFRAATDADARDQALAGLASVLKLLPQPPAAGEEVRKLLIKAKVALDAKDYAEAAALYAQAYRQAPWYAQLYHDRALLIGEMARRPADFDAAIREMRRYLVLTGNPADARAAQDKIYEWEAKRERAKNALPDVAPMARGISATAASHEDCFIATAAYGSSWEPHVATLRAFRDRHLLTHEMGRWLVERYYEISPPLAAIIREREWLRVLVRGVLTPVVWILEAPGLAIGASILMVFWLIAWRRRAA